MNDMKIFKKEINRQTIKENIFYRILAFIIKFFIIIILIAYVVIGVSATISLFQRDIVQRGDISEIYNIVEEADSSGDYKSLLLWLKYRPLEDTDILIKASNSKSSNMPTKAFFTIAARKIKQGDNKEALFWLQLSKYRLRYDVLRCGAQESTKTIDGLLSAILPSSLRKLLEDAQPEQMRETVKRVLVFDKKYPAKNDPEYICKAVNSFEKGSVIKIDKEGWDNLRYQLRSAAKAYLKETSFKTKIEDKNNIDN